MDPVYFSKLLTLQNQWLTARQTAIASNVANANTPAFKAQDVQPFDAVLAATSEKQAMTNPRHMTGGPEDAVAFAKQPQASWEITHSGNSVSLEQELLKAGETTRAYRLNVNLDKAFGRLMDLALKGYGPKG
ncbi:MAG: flagellar basal body rod protein FlgB [Hyphomicrobiales bacterium]|jgi:flagellar basal-body rod protein FlgB|nr:MAG: flagellar basal body rod protein FlgB [Hyphomicrobiales bacterium]